ncbi:twin-arginine translocase TatA/TatE family subunit [Rhodococcus jostii]|uniref:twin-arginine translocase TatA/TatE family subunit n=1 Tax=Rhodococcus jostii TaxID=132919 RepID=UPI003982586F
MFDSKKLPDAARGLGRWLRIFKCEVTQVQKGWRLGADRAAERGSQLPAFVAPE